MTTSQNGRTEERAGGTLRVLMVLQRLMPYVAGAEIQALGLARGLSKLGVDVQFLSTRYVAGLARAEVVRGVPVERVRVLRGPFLKPSQMVSTFAWVARHAHRFDVVHAHCLSSAALGAAVGARIRHVPVILKPSLGGEDGEMAKLRASASWPAVRPILHGIDRFAALDDAIAAELTDAGIRADRIVRIDNGIDMGEFRPSSPDERCELRRRLGLPDGRIVLFLGQLVDRKGIGETIAAWRAIAAAAPDARLVIAGTGPREAEVRRAAAEPDMRVSYLGVRDDVSELVRAADVFVLPSRNESFGNAIVEAMSCAIPVIVGRTGVAARVPVDGDAGIVLDAIDADSVGSAILRLLGDAEASRRMGERGRELASSFSFERVTAKYYGMYRDMLTTARER